MLSRTSAVVVLILASGCHRPSIPVAKEEGNAAAPANRSEPTSPGFLPKPEKPSGVVIGDFAGKWKGSLPRSLTNKGQDLELDIDFDERGAAFPNVRNSEGALVNLSGAGHAQLHKDGEKLCITLLRPWAVTLSADGQDMTWNETGGGRITFTRVTR